MIKFNVEIENWVHYCGEGSFIDQGVSLYVNDILITNNFQESNTLNWEDLFQALGVKDVLVTYKNK